MDYFPMDSPLNITASFPPTWLSHYSSHFSTYTGTFGTTERKHEEGKGTTEIS